MTAIDACEREFIKINDALDTCFSEDGVIKEHCRERVNILMKKRSAFEECIKYLKELYGVKG